jgi:hypothetical protein
MAEGKHVARGYWASEGYKNLNVYFRQTFITTLSKTGFHGVQASKRSVE